MWVVLNCANKWQALSGFRRRLFARILLMPEEGLLKMSPGNIFKTAGFQMFLWWDRSVTAVGAGLGTSVLICSSKRVHTCAVAYLNPSLWLVWSCVTSSGEAGSHVMYMEWQTSAGGEGGGMSQQNMDGSRRRPLFISYVKLVLTHGFFFLWHFHHLNCMLYYCNRDNEGPP